jgi:hypothetical protein
MKHRINPHAASAICGAKYIFDAETARLLSPPAICIRRVHHCTTTEEYYLYRIVRLFRRDGKAANFSPTNWGDRASSGPPSFQAPYDTTESMSARRTKI